MDGLKFRGVHLVPALFVAVCGGAASLGVIASVPGLIMTLNPAGLLVPVILSVYALAYIPAVALAFFPVMLILRYLKAVTPLTMVVSGTLVGAGLTITLPSVNLVLSSMYALAGACGAWLSYGFLKRCAMSDERHSIQGGGSSGADRLSRDA